MCLFPDFYTVIDNLTPNSAGEKIKNIICSKCNLFYDYWSNVDSYVRVNSISKINATITGIGGPGTQIQLLFSHPDSPALADDVINKAVLLRTEKVDSKPCYLLEVKDFNSHRLRYWIDKTDFILWKHENYVASTKKALQTMIPFFKENNIPIPDMKTLEDWGSIRTVEVTYVNTDEDQSKEDFSCPIPKTARIVEKFPWRK